ncbi:MFS general substrate transporter [Schizopora paradoxa]|uniref:MFS general substrate transporter n=1 Tax=Schizopora paradoxa TaxID=27342 RepID=A0A0H2RPA4_9AGAM|nr:MFS general substrate transporter [Schizopora paradoxa]
MASSGEIFTTARVVLLFSALLVALGSGTNYVYSAYAPQLGSRLQISHTKLNVIGLAGNVGVYSSGPVLGKIVDNYRRGLQIILAMSFLSLLIGYNGIRHFYDEFTDDAPGQASISADVEKISMLQFCILAFCSFLTGVGGDGGLTTAMNATAKSFPDRLRASTTGIVISGFGLSAFFFSTIAHVLYPGDTSSFLLLLALGTSIPMVIGFFFVRPMPIAPHVSLPPSAEAAQRSKRSSSVQSITDDEIRSSVFVADAAVYGHLNDSRTNLLHDEHHHGHHHVLIDEESEYVHEDHEVQQPDLLGNGRSVELAISPVRGETRRRNLSTTARRSISRVSEVVRDFHGRTLLANGEFWLLFALLSLLSGTGLMYINNVGLISQALFSKGNPNYDEIESAKWQAMQVSIISIANCLGRIFAGLGADAVKNRLGRPRSYCLCVVAILFILSQLIATKVDEVENLWFASATLGLAYGGIFGLFPTIIIEWFGLGHFSENWGYVAVAPMIGGNLFSLAFGHNIDNHASPPATSNSTTLVRKADLPSGQQCFDGRECYVSSLYLTIFACSVALVLSFYAGRKDRDRMPSDEHGKSDVIWEEDES